MKKIILAILLLIVLAVAGAITYINYFADDEEPIVEQKEAKKPVDIPEEVEADSTLLRINDDIINKSVNYAKTLEGVGDKEITDITAIFKAIQAAEKSKVVITSVPLNVGKKYEFGSKKGEYEDEITLTLKGGFKAKAKLAPQNYYINNFSTDVETDITNTYSIQVDIPNPEAGCTELQNALQSELEAAGFKRYAVPETYQTAVSGYNHYQQYYVKDNVVIFYEEQSVASIIVCNVAKGSFYNPLITFDF